MADRPMLRVRAVGDALVMRLDDQGRAVPNRSVARDATGRPLADGEIVPRFPEYLRAIRRGELELVSDHVAAPDAPAAVGHRRTTKVGE